MPTKTIKLIVLCTLLCCAQFSSGQKIIVFLNIQQPDTTFTRLATKSLAGFLSENTKANKDNDFVYKDELIATSGLLGEIKGMDDRNEEPKEKDYYKCYLTNIIKKDSDNFLFQVSFMHSAEDYATLRASFRLLAKRLGDKFYIYSPLKQNTQAWQSRAFGSLTCHYKTITGVADAKIYQQKVAFYDKKLGLKDGPIDYYYCDDFTEAQQILGIDYKMDYNGINSDSFSSHENNTTLVISGDSDHPHHFNAHDLWHERLRMAMSKTVINRPVDEGCAYLYGGCWNYTWPQLVAKFKSFAAANPNADWLSLYINSVPFESANNSPSESGNKPLYIAYQLNALIVQKIEKEKGFNAVLLLLSCGPRQKGDDNYFAALEKATGITKADFNAEMWKLIKEEK